MLHRNKFLLLVALAALGLLLVAAAPAPNGVSWLGAIWTNGVSWLGAIWTNGVSWLGAIWTNGVSWLG
jgi:hypothetical protein